MHWAITRNGEILSVQEVADRDEIIYCRLCNMELGVKKSRSSVLFFYHKKTKHKTRHDFTKHQFLQSELSDALSERGYNVKKEYILHQPIRADIVVETQDEKMYVFEIQRTPIDTFEIEKRELIYHSQNIPLIWVFVTLTKALTNQLVKLKMWQHQIVAVSSKVWWRDVNGYFEIQEVYKLNNSKFLIYHEKIKNFEECIQNIEKTHVPSYKLNPDCKRWQLYIKQWNDQYQLSHNQDVLWKHLYKHSLVLSSIPHQIYMLLPHFIRFYRPIFWVQLYIYILLKYEQKTLDEIYDIFRRQNILMDKRKHNIHSVMLCYQIRLGQKGLI